MFSYRTSRNLWLDVFRTQIGNMTNFQFEILRLENYKTQQVKSGKPKPRRQRRQEERDRLKTS
jgi:hypothetical protein